MIAIEVNSALLLAGEVSDESYHNLPYLVEDSMLRTILAIPSAVRGRRDHGDARGHNQLAG